MLKQSLALILILLLGISPAKAEKVLFLTLDECLKMVAKNSQEYKIAQMRYEAAKASYNAARLSYFVPNLSLNFTTPDYSWYGEYHDYVFGDNESGRRIYTIQETYDYASSLNLSQKLFTGGDLTLSGLLNSYRQTSNIYPSYDEIRTNLQFSLQQPLFSWNRYKLELDKARVDYNLAKLRYCEEANQVWADLATYYIHYLTSQKQTRIAELESQKAELEYLIAESKKQQGLMGDMEFAQRRTQRLDRKLELIDAMQTLKEFQSKLLLLLKLDEKAELFLSQEMRLEGFSPEKGENSSTEQSSEVLKAEGEVTKRKLELGQARASGGIDGKISLYYGFLGRGPIAKESLDDFKKNRWGVSFVLNLPIWDGGALSSSIASSKLSLEEAKKQCELVKSQAKSKFESLLAKLSATWEKLTLLGEELKIAQDDLNNAHSKKNMGLVSEQQILDAQIIFLESEIKYLNAVLDYRLSRIELDKMWGTVPTFDEK